MNEEERSALLAWLRGPHEEAGLVPGRFRWLALNLLKDLDERVQALERGADLERELERLDRL